ncbi:hypothetical protein CCA_00332 [Chlamydia caviae GPIC]|uniref:Uncharacterized protein n=1 Tax=Chlamydia caviae (strain ATCC VR-813 / DSM 19441 / 03DC25 / GPIC) TaxID=227941 RepID=Q823S4_CHLCV|nr:hypothetical protein CCA_00332 [Chlamydia caviae GPIC]
MMSFAVKFLEFSCLQVTEFICEKNKELVLNKKWPFVLGCDS